MIIINGVIWKLAFVNPYDSILRRPDYTFSIGVCDRPTQTIYLNEALNGILLKKVLCHELVHAAMFSYGISLSVEQEELVAELIATYGEEIIEITNNIFNRLKERVA